MKEKNIPEIIAGAFGMSGGGTLTVKKFSSMGVQTLYKARIPWHKEGRDQFWLIEDWLVPTLTAIMAHAQGETERIGFTTWGADVAFLLPDCQRWIGSHYGSLPRTGINRITKIIPPLEIYLKTGGANVAFFQPYCHMIRMDSDFLKSVRAIISIADLITYILLTGWAIPKMPEVILGQDQDMRQSYGLANGKSPEIYARLFGEDIAEKMLKTGNYWKDKLLVSKNSLKIMPTTHDSIPARKVGCEGTSSEVSIWTGSWVGGDWDLKGKNIQPSKETFKAGLAFEGGHLISNVFMAGPLYDALLNTAGCNYGEAAAYALPLIREHQGDSNFALSELPKDAKKALIYLLKSASSMDSTDEVIANFIQAVANACYYNILAMAEIIGCDPPEKIGVIGGWSNNIAFIEALKILGLDVIVPPGAADATMVGTAAEILVIDGYAITIAEALKMLNLKSLD